MNNDDVQVRMYSKKLIHTGCVMCRKLSSGFHAEKVKDFVFDILVFCSPSGIDSLMKNFPDFATSHKDVAIATFGPATAKAAKEAGLRLDLEAPTEKYPSMTGALQHYLIVNGDD